MSLRSGFVAFSLVTLFASSGVPSAREVDLLWDNPVGGYDHFSVESVRSDGLVVCTDVALNRCRLTLEEGFCYEVRVRGVTADSEFSLFSESVTIDCTSAKPANARPGMFSLGRNYPNPFNPSTTISFTIPESGRVKVSIHNVTGQEVAVVAEGEMPAGSHEAAWNAGEYPSGVYFCTVQYGSARKTFKMTLMK